MRPVPKSFNGNLINSGNFTASFARTSQLQASIGQLLVSPRAGAYPAYAGKTFSVSQRVIDIDCDGDLADDFETLNGYFNVNDETEKQLVVTDTDTSIEYYCYATPIQALNPKGDRYSVVLGLLDPVWQAVTATSVNWSITGSGDTAVVTAGGNYETYPVLTVTPTAYHSGTVYLYQRDIVVYSNHSRWYHRRPIELTGGGWDTTTLVSGGDMQADADDLRVFIDGVEVDRWVEAANTTQTKVWVTFDVPPKQEMTLRTAITTAGNPTWLDMKVNRANRKVIIELPTQGSVLIDSEEFTYKSVRVTETRLRLELDTRSVRNTTAASHAVGATVIYIPYDVTILYGKSDDVAPTVNADDEPLINMSESTNSSFVWESFLDGDMIRPAGWQPELIDRKYERSTSDFYDSDQDASVLPFDTPAEAMGMSIESPYIRGRWRAEDAELAWVIYIPDKISTASSNGLKWRNSSSWPTAELESSKRTYGVSYYPWVTEWAEATPTTASNWTPWTHANEALPTNTRFVRFHFHGRQKANGDSKFEVSDVTLDLTNPPTVIMRSQVDNVQWRATITNQTTGDYIEIDLPLKLNKSIVIDTNPENPSVKRNGRIINGVFLSSNRAKWLVMTNGANTLEYTSDYPTTTTINVEWRNRMNYL